MNPFLSLFTPQYQSPSDVSGRPGSGPPRRRGNVKVRALFRVLVFLVLGSQGTNAVASTLVFESFEHNIQLEFRGYNDQENKNEFYRINEAYSGSGTGLSYTTQLSAPTWQGGNAVVIQSTVSPFSIHIRPDHLEGDLSVANITSEWLFTANENLKFRVFGELVSYLGGAGGFNRASYQVMDVESRSVLAANSFYNMYPDETYPDLDPSINSSTLSIDETAVLHFSKGRSYMLSLNAFTGSEDGIFFDMGASFEPVPEGLHSGIFFGSVLLGMASLRKLALRKKDRRPVA